MTEAEPSTSTPAAESPQRKPRRKFSWRRWLVFLSIPYIIFAAIMAGAEMYVRSTRPYVYTLDIFVETINPDLADQNKQAHVFGGDPYMSWAVLPNLKDVYWNYTTFSTNNEGLRYPGSIGRKKRKALRILCLGDSVTFGFRVPQTWPKTPMDFDRTQIPYAGVMEERLRAANPGREIEVIPLGVPGYTSHQALIWARRDFKRYKPDIVTICYGFNDTYLRAKGDKDIVPMDWLHLLQRRIMMRSQAMIYLTRWMEARRSKGKEKPKEPPPGTPRPDPGAEPITPRVSEEDYVANFLEIARLCKKIGAQPVFLGPVFLNRQTDPVQGLRIISYRRALMKAAEEAGIPFFDFEGVRPSGHPANAPLFGEIIHPNWLGHRLMAASLIDFLAERKLLKDLATGQ